MKIQNFITRYRKATSSFGVMSQMLLEMDLQALSPDETKVLIDALFQRRMDNLERSQMHTFICKVRFAA